MTAAVYIAGAGIHPFGRHDGKGLDDMAVVAVGDALRAARLDIPDMEEAFVGNALGASGVAARMAEALGISAIPVTRIEQACASGSTALRQACEAVASGRRETVLVLGAEKMGGGLLQLTEEPGYEARLGLDLFPLLYGLKARQYMDETGATPADLAAVAVKARALGAAAPHAATDRPASLEEVLDSPLIADPVRRLECCRNADGAAAVVVTAKPIGGKAPRIAAWVGGLAVEDPAAPMAGGWDSRERVVRDLSRPLYEAAGIGPGDIDIVQLNDAFSVAEPLYLEALGFAAPGAGIALQRDGRTAPGGDVPTNTDGGLIGRGHCLGATGVAMLYETWLQMGGRAGPRQVAKTPRTALIQSHGYGGENLFVLEG